MKWALGAPATGLALAAASCVSIPFHAPPGPGAGEGLLAVEPSSVRASGDTRFRFTLTAGPSGLLQGGGFLVRFPIDPIHPYLGFTPPHTRGRHLRGHVICGALRAGRPPRDVEPAVAIAFEHSGEAGCQVAGGRLAPGDVLMMDYWAMAPRAAGDYVLEAVTRVSGGRGGATIRELPVVQVEPREARALRVVLPSEAGLGESLPLAVAALDEFGNRATSYRGSVRVERPGSGLDLNFGEAEMGVAVTHLPPAAAAGFLRASVREHGTDPESLAYPLQAVSNPCRVLEPAQSPGAPVLWGDPDVQLGPAGSGVSGAGSLRSALSHARDAARLDFVALTGAGAPVEDDAAAGVVVLPAFRWRDRLVATLRPPTRPIRSDSRLTDEPAELRAALAGSEPFVVVVPGGAGGQGPGECEEIYSWRNRGMSYHDRPRRFEPALAGPARSGSPVVFCAASANHWGRPGMSALTGQEPGAGGLTAVRAPAGDTAAILVALAAGRGWSTTGDRIYLDVTPDGAGRVRVTAAGRLPLRRVSLVRIGPGGAVETQLLHPPAAELSDTFLVQAAPAGTLAYVRAEQEDGHIAWSNPFELQRP